MTTYAITVPFQGQNGQVMRRTRLVITDAPEDITDAEVLDWIDDYQVWDHAYREDEWTANMQRTADDAPRVKWRGRPGRPAIGAPINVRLDAELLERLDDEAAEHDETRAAAIRRLLTQALKAASKETSC
jgi:hypothetical protein